MNNQTVCCDICGHKLGIVDLDTISVPLKPEMFKSIDEWHGIAPPFQPWMDWIQMVCRQCKHRPFHKEDNITIIDDRGFKTVIDITKIDKEPENKYICKCGKTYKHEQSLIRHQRTCNG